MAHPDLLSKFEYAHIQLLPEFDGTSSCSLDYFIARSESFLNNFKRTGSVQHAELINYFFFNVIKSKLKGQARAILGVEANSSYEKFKEKLITKYGDVKDERLLLKEISNCYQKVNENYSSYYERLSALVLRYKSLCKINYSSHVLELKLKEIDEISLSTFKAGTLEPYRQFLRYAQITDLSHALRICRSYDNDRAYENYMDQLRGTPKQSSHSFNKTYLNKSHQMEIRNPISNPYAISNFPVHNKQSWNPIQPRSHLPQAQNSNTARVTPTNIPQFNNVTSNIRPTFSQNTPMSIRQNIQEQRPLNPVKKPYPTPGVLGRRFATQPQFPKPMSGVSTVRGNFNSHSEVDEEIMYPNPYSGIEQNCQQIVEGNLDYDNYANDDIQSEEYNLEFDNDSQDFRLVAPSDSKT